jgi:hypothetical protein
MKLTLNDLKNTEFYQYLPSEEMKYMTDNQFLAFYYSYDDKTSSIVDIKGVQLISEITLNLNRKRPYNGVIPYDIGFFQQPFDTQNILFYQFLKYYFVNKVSDDKKSDHQTKLYQFLANARAMDLQSIEERQKNTFYENSFQIFSRDNFINSVDRFVQTKQQVKDDVVRIADTIDTHTRTVSNKSLFGDMIKKVVMAVRTSSGELIPEKMGVMRYMYCGEKSEMAKNDKTLEEAKTMFRNNFSPTEIYAKTNWFFNQNDQMWRKRIVGDKEAQVPSLSLNDVYIPTTSSFISRKSEVYELMNSNNITATLPMLEGFLRKGWDVTLGQVLEHKELYKHYPSLYKMPIFYANNSKKLGSDNDYAFFYNDSGGYLFIYGNENDFDLKTVLLHEVQHAIQHIEGFGQGGDNKLAKMIQALGGEGVKQYFFISNKLKDMYSKEANHDGLYSYTRYAKYYKNIKLSDGEMLSEENYYNSIKDMVFEMINSYLNANDLKKKFLVEFLGTSFCEKVELLIKYFKEGQKASVKLLGQGFNENQIRQIFFQTYEHLAGEIESRDVQHVSQIEEEILGYALPLSSESIQQKKVTAIYNSLIEEKTLPEKIMGAVETIEGEYIIHLNESVSAVPILHEIGHIVCDIIGRENVELTIADKIEKEKIDKAGGLSEVFVQIFLNYISKQPLSPRTLNEIKETAQFQEINYFDKNLDEIFYPKAIENESELQKMLFFVKKLEALVDGSLPIELPVEKVEETVEVVEVPKSDIVETPKEETKDEQGFVSVTKNITNLSQLKNHLKLGTVLRVSFNKNKPDWVGTFKTVSYVQTNGIYLASGTEIPKEAEGTDKPFSIKGLSWLEFPKASNFNFTPNGFEILYKDKDGNLMPFLGYEYVEKVSGSSTPTPEKSTEPSVPEKKHSTHIERMLSMNENKMREEVEGEKIRLKEIEGKIKDMVVFKDNERQRLKSQGYNNFQINTRVSQLVKDIEKEERQKKETANKIIEIQEIADRVEIVKNVEASNKKIKELVDYIEKNRELKDKPDLYYKKENDLRKYLGCFVYLYTDKKPRPNIYDLIDFYLIFVLDFLMKNEFDNLKKLSDMYLQDFRAEAERLQVEWRAENPPPAVYKGEEDRVRAMNYAKNKIKENAKELKMI